MIDDVAQRSMDTLRKRNSSATPSEGATRNSTATPHEGATRNSTATPREGAMRNSTATSYEGMRNFSATRTPESGQWIIIVLCIMGFIVCDLLSNLSSQCLYLPNTLTELLQKCSVSSEYCYSTHSSLSPPSLPPSLLLPRTCWE